MAVRKLKNSWWIDFQFNHTRYRKRSPENTRAGALVYEAFLRQRLARGEAIESDVLERGLTFEQFAWKWFDEYVVPNNKYSEQWTKRTVLRSSLIPFFGQTPVRMITSRQIEQYKVWALQKGLARKTINNHLAIFGKCVRTAYEWLVLPGTPPSPTLLKCPQTIADYLSPDECSLLLSRAGGTTYEMLLTALRTGMRQGEIRGLQWASIDWQILSVAVQHSRCDYSSELTSPKNNRIRHIPLDIDVYEVLLARKRDTGYVFLNENGQPLDSQCMKRRLARVRHRAELRKIGWHTLRHTFASHLVMRGVPMTAVQMLMGHSSITTTMRYAHLAPATLRSAIDMLNPRTAVVDAELGQPAVNPWVKMQRQELAQRQSPEETAEKLDRIAA